MAQDEYLFCNIAWMKYYQGQQVDDHPIGGGNDQNKHECCNFVDVGGQHYGYVQVSGRLERLPPSSRGDDRVEGVTVVWTATDPDRGGNWVVGWYRNATVFREWQPLRGRSNLHKENKIADYRIVAPSNQSHLIHHSRRRVPMPTRTGVSTDKPEWGRGTSLVTYPRDKNGNLHPSFLRDASQILKLVRNGPTGSIGNTADEIEEHLEHDQSLTSTERNTLIKARRGQGRFRTLVSQFAGGRCLLTKIENSDLLRASHIKPWAKCDTNDERVDGHNGLFLSPTADHLFDGGLITFDSNGALIVSNGLSSEDRKTLGFDFWSQKVSLSAKQLKYMEYHRQHVFEKKKAM